MSIWDYDDEMDSYDRMLMREAKEAMNDREVGLMGQAKADIEYEKLKKKYEDD